MVKSICNYCEGTGLDYWEWEEAFDKFGFGDGDGYIRTPEVEKVLNGAGYEAESQQWGLHNVCIISIKKDGRELMPHDSDEISIGYDDPRNYLPNDVIELLDENFKNEEDPTGDSETEIGEVK